MRDEIFFRWAAIDLSPAKCLTLPLPVGSFAVTRDAATGTEEEQPSRVIIYTQATGCLSSKRDRKESEVGRAHPPSSVSDLICRELILRVASLILSARDVDAQPLLRSSCITATLVFQSLRTANLGLVSLLHGTSTSIVLPSSPIRESAESEGVHS